VYTETVNESLILRSLRLKYEGRGLFGTYSIRLSSRKIQPKWVYNQNWRDEFHILGFAGFCQLFFVWALIRSLRQSLGTPPGKFLLISRWKTNAQKQSKHYDYEDSLLLREILERMWYCSKGRSQNYKEKQKKEKLQYCWGQRISPLAWRSG